jgi:outer membrane protein assembly factor BamA
MFRIAFFLLFVLMSQIGVSQTKNITLNFLDLNKKAGIVNPQKFKDSTTAFNGLKKEIDRLKFLGYFDVDIKSYQFKNDTLKVRVTLGKQYDGLKLENGNIPDHLVEELSLKDQFKKDKPIAFNNLNRVYQRILGYYEDNGYPFVSVYIDSLVSVSDVYQAKLFVSPNRNIKLDTIRLVGSAKLNQSFLNSYLGLKTSQNYNQSKVSLIDRRLKDLSYLTVVKPSEVVFGGENATINVFIDKQNANQFDGIIGFLPNSQTGKLQLTGDFKLNLKNALKGGEMLDFNYRGLPSQSQELALKFSYPYVFKTQLGVNADFQLFKRDSSFLNLTTKIAFDYNFSTTKRLSFFVENFNGNHVSKPNTISVIPNFANISTVFYGLSAAYIKLDQKITPLKGFDLEVQAAIGTRKINPSENFRPEDVFESANSQQLKAVANLKYYLKTGSRSVIYLHNYTGILSGKNIFDNEAFRIGGFKTLRGFDEQSIITNAFSVQTIEFRYLIEQNSFINLFVDQAYISQTFVNLSENDFPLGIGAGITFQTKVGIASLNYALGKARNNPLNLQNGKIHFGIISYF